jgi:SPP1 family predicted phage head-tail adaptor
MIPKKQIRVEKWIAPKDASGDAKERIEVAYNLWAEPVKIGGNRNDTMGQTRFNNRVSFKIRFRPDWKINSAWKIDYLGERYTITNIQRIDEKRYNWLINGEN